MRTLAIGDIHGASTAFDALLGIVKPGTDDVIVTLGDYVDRGPDSHGVMNRLLRLASGGQLVPLLGNHEQMMMEARNGESELNLWLSCGGDAALRSYAVLGDAGSLVDVPEDHWRFLDESCRDYFETDTHIFAHAGLYPDLPLADQPVFLLRWEPFNDPAPHESGKILVCGHTAQRSGKPRNIGHAICIDTHAHGGGWLTCLECESGRIYQANQRGETRTGWVDE